MRAAVVVSVVCYLFAVAKSQSASAAVAAQLNSPAVQSVLNKIPEGKSCRSNAKIFIQACTKDLVETTSLKNDLKTLLSLVKIDTASNTLQIHGNAFAGFIDQATASKECCTAACNIAKVGCMCHEDAWKEVERLFSLNGSGAESVFTKVENKCKGDGRSFQAVFNPAKPKCAPEFAKTARTFTC